jgi:hypothetical protein
VIPPSGRRGGVWSFAVPIALATLVAACSAPVQVPAHDRADLEAQALDSVKLEYAFLIDPTADTRALVGARGEDCRERPADERRAHIERRRVGNAAYGVRFVEARVDLTGGPVRVAGGTLVLRAEERTDLVSDAPARKGDVTGFRVPHDFVYELRDARWVLVWDRPAGMGCGLPAP